MLQYWTKCMSLKLQHRNPTCPCLQVSRNRTHITVGIKTEEQWCLCMCFVFWRSQARFSSDRKWNRILLQIQRLRYGMDNRTIGVIFCRGLKFISSQEYPDQRWSPPSLLPSGHYELFSQEEPITSSLHPENVHLLLTIVIRNRMKVELASLLLNRCS
jgi:hypothetical protein